MNLQGFAHALMVLVYPIFLPRPSIFLPYICVVRIIALSLLCTSSLYSSSYSSSYKDLHPVVTNCILEHRSCLKIVWSLDFVSHHDLDSLFSDFTLGKLFTYMYTRPHVYSYWRKCSFTQVFAMVITIHFLWVSIATFP